MEPKDPKEMTIRFVTPVKWILHRKRLLAFMAAFGEGAVDGDALRRLAALDPVLLGRPDRTGAACAVAKLGGGTAGVALAAGRGREAFAVVVHPALRGRGIGTRLTRALLERIGALECRVPAADSRAVAMCRRAGMAVIEAPEGADGGFVRLAGASEPAGVPGAAGVPEPAGMSGSAGVPGSAGMPGAAGVPGAAGKPGAAAEGRTEGAGQASEQPVRGGEP